MSRAPTPTTKPLVPWDQFPGETDLGFAAFNVFKDLPVNGTDENKRTLANVARLTDASEGTVRFWSSKFQWFARARAYAVSQGKDIMVVKEAALSEYRANVVGKMSEQLIAVDELIDGFLMRLKQNLDAGEPVKTTDLTNVMNALKAKDDLARRLGKMPTSFLNEGAVEVENEDQETVYLVGGN